MIISANVNGLAEVLSNLNNENGQLNTKIDRAIQGAGISCQAYAKQSCPVDTGRLRNSILYNPGTLSCYVNTNVVYAPYVEFGTKRMAAQPFLYPAYAQAMQELVEELSAL